ARGRAHSAITAIAISRGGPYPLPSAGGVRAPHTQAWPDARAAGRLDRLAHAQVKALEQAGDAVGLHFKPVARAQLGQLLGLSLQHAAHVHELLEEALKTCRGDDLQDARRLVAGVPEGVPLIARLEDQ